MKVHYINILLGALPLNILAYNQRNHKSTTHHTPKIQITRLLCECELYAPANYDNDAQMKKVMENFNKQTQQRFNEYDDRMIEKRQKCKEQCDKEIQKIILKDKLEKELMDKFATLQTDIKNDAIPTCICEKSMADKVEKTCLRCGSVFGGGVAPSVGLLGGIGIYGWIKGVPAAAAIAAAKKAGALAGLAAGLKEGKEAVIGALTHYGVKDVCPKAFESIRNIKYYADVTKFSGEMFAEYKQICVVGTGTNGAACSKFNASFGLYETENLIAIGDPINEITKTIKSALGPIKKVADKEAARVTGVKTAELQETYMAAVNTAYGGFQTAIIASVVAMVIIVLIMVIIYKILRYRRKKKMKKKLQYIKLLEE
ncbi:rifin PIR protein, putative [Plasmodium reichenowi]|uniref:Rifin PIR protein, putative n=1 Tax=Plasmodium reichenowi TaxID=5854 RepID=A0A2P9D6G9_PLARE|nr:rifin PIR protein, putative [Plasmodium reichenowi]